MDFLPIKCTAMASRLLSFICHVPDLTPGAHPALPMTKATGNDHANGQLAEAAPSQTGAMAGGHFAPIYENERFIRFKFISENKGR
ncbi:hypothetical protein LRS06_16455 [Hymenobacter sp. J193]|uniref:hypothetical protein n=1 Tax=Hymenobacter sp. J193 TaxID=2898429 RepID=UPI00215096F4|nr:hypothetical protein [Hymenobacter sp. J193]MCR5889328.1 hypothetical protein [Hymenobacter sp. J193]